MKDKKGKVKNIITKHILNNKKEYLLISLMFVIGIFLGVFFINHTSETQNDEITNYFLTSIEKLKETQELQTMNLLQDNIVENIVLGIILWFLGTTIIGIPIVLGIILYRGFCLGYTISASIVAFGNIKGTIFMLSTLLLHNIIFIPGILAIGVSGLKLYKSIIKDKRKQNIKLEIIRHTFFSLIMTSFLVVSSVVEVFITTNIIMIILKYL